MPFSGDEEGDEGQEGSSLSPSLSRIRLPCRSLTGRRQARSPSMPPSGEQQRPMGTIPAAPSEYPPSQPPPWTPRSALRHPLRGRGSMGGGAPSSSRRPSVSAPPGKSSVSVPGKSSVSVPGKCSVSVPWKCSEHPPMKSLSLNPDMEWVARREPKPPHSQSALIGPVKIPTTPVKKRKREAASQLQLSDLSLAQLPLQEENEELTQEDLALTSSSPIQEDSALTSSSPIREPKPPLVPIWTNSEGKVYYGLSNDQVALDKYYQAYRKYEEKQACQDQLPTLKLSMTYSSIKESFGPKQKEIILESSRSILNLSSYLDDQEINRCTGIVIEWNEEKKCGIVLTSAWLISTRRPFDDWSHKEYASNAKVLVHLLDGSTLDSKLLYFSKQYDLAFYEFSGDLHLKMLPLEANLECGQELCLLARDMNMDLICKAVSVKYLAPCEYQRSHYLFVNHSIPKCGSGGALADLNGNIVGMLFSTLPLTSFIPSSLIIKCSMLFKKFGRLARPMLGLKLRTVGFLDVSTIELLSRTCGITSGLVVGEVSAGCVAERFGIRAGDVILSCQGESVSTVPQLEEILLGIGAEHLEEHNDLGLKVAVVVDVYHVRSGTRETIPLNVELSDGNEVFHSVILQLILASWADD